MVNAPSLIQISVAGLSEFARLFIAVCVIILKNIKYSLEQRPDNFQVQLLIILIIILEINIFN